MFTCIYSKKLCLSSPKEHILQNIFGGALTSDAISSNECQAMFAESIDLAVANQMNPFRNLIDTKSGRGAVAPPIKDVISTSGGKYELNHGGRPHLCKPCVIFEERDEKVIVNATVDNPEQLRWVDAIVKKKCPGVRRQEAIRLPNDSKAKESFAFKIHVAGKDFARGILKSCFNLLGYLDPELALSEIFDPLRGFVLNGNGDVLDFASSFCPPGKLGVDDYGTFSHVLCIYPKGGRLCAYARFWGEIGFVFRLTENYHGDFCAAYHLDPTHTHVPKEHVVRRFDCSSLPTFTIDKSESCAKKGMEAMQVMFNKFDFNRRCSAICGRALIETCKRHGVSEVTLSDREINSEIAGQIASEMIKEFGHSDRMK